MTETVALVLKAGLTITALGLISWPLLLPKISKAEDTDADRKVRDLLDEKERLLVEIKDLELSRETGKISPEDYEPMVKRAKAAAADVLRQIDEMARTGQVASPEVPAAAPATPDPKPVVENACPQCGAETDSDDAFCRKCGTKITQ